MARRTSSSKTSSSKISIGGASGYWGESAASTPQLLAATGANGALDFIVYDYLAEITMSILARAKAKDPQTGYATDFITAVLKPNLAEIAEKKVRLISNAGGVNPQACAAAAREAIADAGLDLKVAVVSGDDLTTRKDEIAGLVPNEMFSGEAFPPTDKISSINAYLGAFPIARALDIGADIVITGRCVDSAVTLGACIHAFGWTPTDYDKLSSGSLAGHILECGPQATGGNFTDWEDVEDISAIGYPIAHVDATGAFDLTKPDDTGGLVSVGTICEQMLYEIGDPQNYELPDVVCDFSEVKVRAKSDNIVSISPAKGRAPSEHYKACLTWHDGWRGGVLLSYYGVDADKKAQRFAEAAVERARNTFRNFNAGDFREVSIEIIGAESQYGDFARIDGAREVVLKLAAKHDDAMGVGLLLKEAAGLGLAAPPGLSSFAGGRPKPSPVIRLFSFLLPKEQVQICVEMDGATQDVSAPDAHAPSPPTTPHPFPQPPATDEQLVETPLIDLAWARSGDKGDKANIGVIARKPEYFPYICASLTEAAVAARIAHFIKNRDPAAAVSRYCLPGSSALNFLIDQALGGGGVASLRNDPQGKGYAQLILEAPIAIPPSIIGDAP